MKIKYPLSALVLALSLQFIAPVTGVTVLTADSAFAGSPSQPGEEGVGKDPDPPGPSDADDPGYRDPPPGPPDPGDALDVVTNPPPPPTAFAASSASSCGPASATCNNGN